MWSVSPLSSEREVGVGGGGNGAGPGVLPPSLRRVYVAYSPNVVVSSCKGHLKAILLLPSVKLLED